MYNWSIYFVYLHDCKQIGVSGEDLFIPQKIDSHFSTFNSLFCEYFIAYEGFK